MILHSGILQSEMSVAALVHSASSSPVLLGLTYALLHIVGPDHLGTIVALSVTAAAPREAFYLGVSWSLGHCIGMVVVAALIASIQTVVKVDVDLWEHAGAYLIGASLVACGAYFLLHEQSYLEERSDGSVSLKSCSCSEPSGHAQEVGAVGSASAFNRGVQEGRGSCSTHLAAPTGSPSAPSAQAAVDRDPPLSTLGANIRGALLGIVQGMACPGGLMGIAMIVGLSGYDIAIFLVIFLWVSAVGMGAAAAFWMWCTTLEASQRMVSSRTLFRLSCVLTICLGGLWVGANYSGQLDKLEHSMHSMPAAHL